jgi:hypothetical protein
MKCLVRLRGMVQCRWGPCQALPGSVSSSPSGTSPSISSLSCSSSVQSSGRTLVLDWVI